MIWWQAQLEWAHRGSQASDRSQLCGGCAQVEANFGATPFVADFLGLVGECKERLKDHVLSTPLPGRGKVAC